MYAFVKKTPKRIYLRSGRRDTYWEIDGTSSYSGTIHPEDLVAILDGSISATKGTQ